jgi:hypothetical protein
MKWYIPSWNGDLRLFPLESNEKHTVLEIERPTPSERKIIEAMTPEFVKRGWIEEGKIEVPAKHRLFSHAKQFELTAPLEEVGPVVAKLMKPQDAVLSAIKFRDGRVETCSGSLAELEAMSKEAAAAPLDKPAEAAATVKRPTPSCPSCIPGSIGPAREVLLAFLSEAEHRSWADKRAIVIEGGLSGHRYLLAHRHTPLAQRHGRICVDLDDNVVIHFHDWSVPPEEEVLAAKLILEHREPWLRNEATAFFSSDVMFKNPFGDGLDGIADAQLTRAMGAAFASVFGVRFPQQLIE